MSNNAELVEKFYRKKFAREARWEEWRERFIGIMERFHINYHSYADEYEESWRVKNVINQDVYADFLQQLHAEKKETRQPICEYKAALAKYRGSYCSLC